MTIKEIFEKLPKDFMWLMKDVQDRLNAFKKNKYEGKESCYHFNCSNHSVTCEECKGCLIPEDNDCLKVIPDEWIDKPCNECIAFRGDHEEEPKDNRYYKGVKMRTAEEVRLAKAEKSDKIIEISTWIERNILMNDENDFISVSRVLSDYQIKYLESMGYMVTVQKYRGSVRISW